MHIALIGDVGLVHFDNYTADPACLGVPANVVTHLESLPQGFSSTLSPDSARRQSGNIANH